MKGLFRFFASLKLAVISILSLASVLAYATVAESYYGMRGAHLLVYGQWWFGGLLFLLGLNVFCAGLSRWPWKPRHTGFLVTHLGILIILFGSFLTQQYGVDGNLPVREGAESGSVLMPELALVVRNETNEVVASIPVPEYARRKEGELLTVDLGGDRKWVINEYLPRAVSERKIAASPLTGVGTPAIRIEIASSRFQMEEWLKLEDATKSAEWNLGPASLTLKKLWTPAEEREMLVAAKKKDDGGPIIFVKFEGREYRVAVLPSLKKWSRVASSGLEIYVEKYLPYAIVEKNELVSKSQEPKNPAVQILIRKAGTKTIESQERHTLFAFYPEFNTLHRKPGSVAPLGAQFRLQVPNQDGGEGRGKLEIAVGSDDKTLYYRSTGANGDVKGQGKIQPGEEVATGWMDIKFKIAEWYPAAMEDHVPRYIDQVAGTDGNFVTAIRMAPKGVKGGEWILEGGGRTIPVGNETWSVQLTRRTLELPFRIFLNKFTVGTDPGTTKAASYESNVKLSLGKEVSKENFQISMNEPLKHGGYTFYQASYQMEEGRPPVSIFSVNRDPGRSVKYLGCLVMVLGIILMFYLNPHYWDKVLGRAQ